MRRLILDEEVFDVPLELGAVAPRYGTFPHCLMAADIKAAYAADVNFMLTEYEIRRPNSPSYVVLFVAIPGTKDPEDLKTLKDGDYHAEAMRLLHKIGKQIKGRIALYDRIVIGGHSMGGILATLLAKSIWVRSTKPTKVELVTYGMPRHEYIPADGLSEVSVVHYRMKRDLVPYLPFSLTSRNELELKNTVILDDVGLMVRPTLCNVVASLLPFPTLKNHSIQAYQSAIEDAFALVSFS